VLNPADSGVGAPERRPRHDEEYHEDGGCHDGAPGLDAALAVLWSDVAIQRCTVHKHRNLLAHAPERLHEEISNDYKDMIYADTKQEIATKRPAFIRKWRLKCKAVADSLDEAGDKLFTFTHFPKSQWKSIRTSNAIERLHEEFKRRIKTQTVLPSAETASRVRCGGGGCPPSLQCQHPSGCWQSGICQMQSPALSLESLTGQSRLLT
jgi:Transposase, Mutator family